VEFANGRGMARHLPAINAFQPLYKDNNPAGFDVSIIRKKYNWAAGEISAGNKFVLIMIFTFVYRLSGGKRRR
jgi:hypothetical protein